jgi:redox-sensitive bicupin YhaK (pirin superfamily)
MERRDFIAMALALPIARFGRPDMMTIRRAEERGHADHGWLDTRHTFSFASYYDPRHMGFRALRVINDDRVTPGAGFPTHPHRDMEIISYVVEGALEHKDSMGNGSVIRPGDVQRMTAGTGVTHSEFNPSQEEGARFLQIWILPAQKGLTPGYQQKSFERDGRLRLVASPDGRDGSIRVHQDVAMYAARLAGGERAEHAFAEGRHGWVQVVSGEVVANGERLREGDGAALSATDKLSLRADGDAEVLLFDLA